MLMDLFSVVYLSVTKYATRSGGRHCIMILSVSNFHSSCPSRTRAPALSSLTYIKIGTTFHPDFPDIAFPGRCDVTANLRPSRRKLIGGFFCTPSLSDICIVKGPGPTFFKKRPV